MKKICYLFFLPFCFSAVSMKFTIDLSEDFKADSAFASTLESFTDVDWGEDKRQERFAISLDGGGIKGLMQSVWLKDLEIMINEDHHNDHSSNKPIGEMIDYIGGTSIGGIMATACASLDPGTKRLRTAQSVHDFFDKSENYECVFPTGVARVQDIDVDEVLPGYFISRIVKKIKGGLRDANAYTSAKFEEFQRKLNITHARYNPILFEKLLEGYFQEQSFDDIRVPLLVTSADRLTSHPFFFRNDAPRGGALPQDNYALKDIARATSAAPVFFPSAEITSTLLKQKSSLIDGGMVYNNPAAVIFANTIQRFDKPGARVDRHNVVLLSLGTGEEPDTVTSAEDGGYLLTLDSAKDLFGMPQPKRIINALMTLNSRGIHDQLSLHVPKKNYIRINPPLGSQIDLDSISGENIAKIKMAAQHESVKPKLTSFLELYRKKKEEGA